MDVEEGEDSPAEAADRYVITEGAELNIEPYTEVLLGLAEALVKEMAFYTEQGFHEEGVEAVEAMIEEARGWTLPSKDRLLSYTLMYVPHPFRKLIFTTK